MQTPDEPQTIFDLTPDELDTLILYRKLSPEHQQKLSDQIYELTKNRKQER